MSVDLMTAPARDEEKLRLDARFKELEEETSKLHSESKKYFDSIIGPLLLAHSVERY